MKGRLFGIDEPTVLIFPSRVVKAEQTDSDVHSTHFFPLRMVFIPHGCLRVGSFLASHVGSGKGDSTRTNPTRPDSIRESLKTSRPHPTRPGPTRPVIFEKKLPALTRGSGHDP